MVCMGAVDDEQEADEYRWRKDEEFHAEAPVQQSMGHAPGDDDSGA